MKKQYIKCYRVDATIHAFQKATLQHIKTTYNKNITFSQLVGYWWELLFTDEEFRKLALARIEEKIIKKTIDTSSL